MFGKVGVGSVVASRALTKELENVGSAPGVVSTACAPSFSVVSERDEWSGCVLGNAPGLSRDPFVDILVELQPAFFGKNGVVFLAPGLEGGGRVGEVPREAPGLPRCESLPPIPESVGGVLWAKGRSSKVSGFSV